MAVEFMLDNLDNVPDVLKAEYVQQGDKFVLQVNGAKPQAEFDRVNGALNKERTDHGALKTRVTQHFGDRKFEEVVADLDKIDEYKAAAEGKLDDEKINGIVEGRVKTRLAPVERDLATARQQLGERDAAIGQFQGRERTRAIRDAVREAATGAKVQTEAMDDALLLGDSIFEVREDDGKVVVREGTAYTQGIEPAVLFADLKTKKPHWFGESRGGGAGGSRGGGPNGGPNPWSKDGWNMTEQGRIYLADPAKAEQLAKAAGHKQALGATPPAK